MFSSMARRALNSATTTASFARVGVSAASSPFASASASRSSASLMSASSARLFSSSSKNTPPLVDHGGSYDKAFETDVWHNDPEQDGTNRASHYLIMGGARMMYASTSRLLALQFISSMSAAADVKALSSIEIDVSGVKPGTAITVKWRGKPIFVRHRTEKEIALAVADDGSDSLRDPETDAQRTKEGHQNLLVVVGVCTHLGCVPINNAGDYKGWFCPCHGSHYDTSGRIRKGPAPLNLEVPEYKFLSPKTILVG